MRPRSITDESIKLLIDLYSLDVPIKEIMRRTGIKSEQTIYRLLDKEKVPRKPKKRCPFKCTVSFEEDVIDDVLLHKGEISTFVCECIRKVKEAAE